MGGNVDLRILRAAFSPQGLRRGALVLTMICAAGGARGANYAFLSAPEIDLNRVYRLDRETGEVGACQYGLKEGSVGVTLCYPPGDGAGRRSRANMRWSPRITSTRAASSGSISTPA